jgi:hypothetical protein
VDAAKGRRPINPGIYGLNHADTATLRALNSPLNRFGGNRRSRYNWQQNVDNTGSDYFFLSFPFDPTPGELADTHVGHSVNAGAHAMITIPMIDFVAKTDTQRDILCSFRQSVYGPQTGSDPFNPDCGTGIELNGQLVVGNDPLDANIPNSPGLQSSFVQHLVGKCGLAANGGVRYYLLDNEPAIWFQTHRDVHPLGASYDEMASKMLAYAQTIKSVDAGAQVVGPEEFGWTGYFLSGLDIQTCDAAEAVGDFTCYPDPPDRAAHGRQDYVAFLLDRFRLAQSTYGRLLDVFSLHYYPQADGIFSDDVDGATQDRRSRSTRALWDPTYVDESYIGEPVSGHRHRDHRVSLGRRESHQRRDGAGGRARNFRARGSRPGDPLHGWTTSAGDVPSPRLPDLPELRWPAVRLRRHARPDRGLPWRRLSPGRPLWGVRRAAHHRWGPDRDGDQQVPERQHHDPGQPVGFQKCDFPEGFPQLTG